MRFDSLRPIAVPPAAGRVLNSVGVQDKLIEEQTGGAIYLFESKFGPGDDNRLHVHRYEDELAYVLEGAITIRLGDQNLEVGAGGVAYLPKNIPHALRNPLATASRYLFAAIPGGYIEHWFEATEAAEESGGLDDTAYRELSLRYGIEWLE
jgi:quercetin dioxygenase-like cupin family protein